MGSANQVPYGLAGYDARDIRRGVLVLAADFCTIISQVLLTRGSFSSDQMWVVGCVAGEHGPDNPSRFIGHRDCSQASRFTFE